MVEICRWCGAEMESRMKLMNHAQNDCLHNPKSRSYTGSKELTEKPVPSQLAKATEPGATEAKAPAVPADEEYLDEMETLAKIIGEVYKTKKIPGIVRMVRRAMGNKRDSITALSEALRLADTPGSQRNLILKNWAAHLDVPDIGDILESEKKEEEKKTEKKADKEKEIKTATEEILEKGLKDELRELELLRLRKQRKILEKELLDEPKKDEEPEKVTMVVDGITMSLTPDKALAWKRYQLELKKMDEERDDRKEERKSKEAEERVRREEGVKRKDDELVEWPIGDKVIKVRHETIPMLVMQQSQKKGGDSDDMKVLRDELKENRDMFNKFQSMTFQKEIEELKLQASVDPLDRIYSQKEKLEKLGLVGSSRVSAQDRMFEMDRSKLDTMLTIVTDKTRSLENKVDLVMKTFGPVAQEYVKEAVITMKRSRGETEPPEEVPRTAEEAADTLAELEKVDKAMSKPATEPESGGGGGEPSRVVSVGDAGKKPRGAKKEGVKP